LNAKPLIFAIDCSPSVEFSLQMVLPLSSLWKLLKKIVRFSLFNSLEFSGGKYVGWLQLDMW
jgi:hypothetical protein